MTEEDRDAFEAGYEMGQRHTREMMQLLIAAFTDDKGKLDQVPILRFLELADRAAKPPP